MKTILLLEDDKSLNRGISFALQKEGYQVYSAFTIAEAKESFHLKGADMVISDITLPDGSGLEFGQMVREESNTCLLYLTALDTEIDIVNGYDSGADDYITKPFSLMVLISKVNAMMRRLTGKDANVLVSKDIEVRLNEAKVYQSGQELSLSKTEMQLLIYLLENAGQILSKETILDKIWGIDGQFVDDNTVTVNISRLRNKLGTDYISNVRGLGYLWNGAVTRK